MPTLGDPRFEKALIFICAHDDKGAMGIVINHVLPDVDFLGLLEQLNVKSDIDLKAGQINIPVMRGGPVETARGFMLHDRQFNTADTIFVGQDYGVTGTLDALSKIVTGQGPENLIFALGYAGWAAGQLEQEIQQNAWLVSDPDPDLIFKTAHTHMWDKAVRGLGIDPVLFSGQAGSA